MEHLRNGDRALAVGLRERLGMLAFGSSEDINAGRRLSAGELSDARIGHDHGR